MKNDQKQKCRAKNKSGGYCNHPAGFRTDHAGAGKCYLHGGRGGGTIDNKNAVKTGEFETITFDSLTDNELQILDNLVIDKKKQLEEEIKLITIREIRMMNRINLLTQKEDNDGLILTESTDQEGSNHNGDYDSITKRKTLAIDTIIRIEDALTRVQLQKLKYIEASNKLTQEDSGSGENNNEGIKAMFEALKNS